MIKAYYRLAKPGIIYGNLLTVIAGFLLASEGHVAWGLFAATLLGVALVMGSACVFNNYIDRGIDRKMARTKKRALVSGEISGRSALIYAAALGVAGFIVLGIFTNALTVLVGVIGIVDYVVLYGIGKRRSTLGTLIGSVSGATPLVAGYTAVTGRFDLEALLLFLILALWQMPHFYAIAMYRFKDYAAAALPVLPVKKGMRATKVHIVLYIFAFVLAVLAMTALGYTGYLFAVVMGVCGVAWLHLAWKGFETEDDRAWARRMFFLSLVIILVLSAALSVGALLP